MSEHVGQDLAAFVEEFKSESDRAIVVLTAARLDYLLFGVLQKYLVPNPNATDAFFENQGPGSTFSNKIILAYRLALIDRDFARSLNTIRNIRNDFAHETSNISLERGSHKDRVASLCAPYKKYPFFSEFKKLFFDKVPPSRADFLTIVGVLIIRLTYCLGDIDSVGEQNMWEVVTENMKKPSSPPNQIENGK